MLVIVLRRQTRGLLAAWEFLTTLRIPSSRPTTLDDLGQELPAGHDGDAARAVLGEARELLAGCHRELLDRIGEFEERAREADNLNSRLYREVIASRMRPFSDGTHGFPRLADRDTRATPGVGRARSGMCDPGLSGAGRGLPGTPPDRLGPGRGDQH